MSQLKVSPFPEYAACDDAALPEFARFDSEEAFRLLDLFAAVAGVVTMSEMPFDKVVESVLLFVASPDEDSRRFVLAHQFVKSIGIDVQDKRWEDFELYTKTLEAVVAMRLAHELAAAMPAAQETPQNRRRM